MPEEKVDTTQVLHRFTKKEPEVNHRVAPYKIEMPKEGGIKSYYKGFKYPYPGYRSRLASKQVEITKRSLKIRMKEIVKNPINYLGKIKKKVHRWINFANWALRDIKLKPKLYSRPVRQVYNAFTKVIERENGLNMKDKLRKIRDVICIILEFDNAYRFRVQDVLSEIDPEKMKLDKVDKYFKDKGNKSTRNYG